LAAILDRLPDALLLIDPAGVVENANAKALEAFGAGPGRPLIGLVASDLLPSLSDVTAAVDAADGKARQMVARALDGMVFGVEATCTSVPWGGGEERLLICLHASPAVDAEAELMRTGRAAQAVLRSTEEAICGVDRDGRVVLANPAAGRLFGVRVSAIAGQDLHAMALHTRVDGTACPAAESPVARILRSGRRIQRRREIVWRADGTPVPVELSASAIRDGAEVAGAVFAFTDLTERHELDRRRRRLVDLLANRIEPELAGLAGSDSAETVAGLRAALAAALDYENLMGGQGWDDRSPTPIGPVVDAAVAAVQGAADERGVRVESGRRLGVVEGYSIRLTRAVAELLRIAVAGSTSGRTVDVSAESDADHVYVRVSGAETGRSTDPLLQRLRAPRGTPGAVDPDLAFVQLVAEGHGGRLLIESADGRRSYVLELPLVRAAAAAMPVRRHARVEAASQQASGQDPQAPGTGASAQAPAAGNVISMSGRRPAADLAEAASAAPGPIPSAEPVATPEPVVTPEPIASAEPAVATEPVVTPNPTTGPKTAVESSPVATVPAAVPAVPDADPRATAQPDPPSPVPAMSTAPQTQSATVVAGSSGGPGDSAVVAARSPQPPPAVVPPDPAAAESTVRPKAPTPWARAVGETAATPVAPVAEAARIVAPVHQISPVAAVHAAPAPAPPLPAPPLLAPPLPGPPAPAPAPAPPALSATGHVLAWPRPTPGLADALGVRGLGSTALDRPGPPAVMPAGTAIVLIDPQGGTIGRRMLHELSAAVVAARLPLILTFGFTEFGDGEQASEPTALVGAVFPDPGRELNLLVVEEDPAVAAVLGEQLTAAGYRATHARGDARAAPRAADARPDLVLRNLALSVEKLDWLRAGNGLAPIPVVAYTTDDLTPGHQERLAGGRSKLGLAARAAGPEFDERLAVLLAALGG
jgi:PAS domain S-box-containing protein